MTLRAPDPLEQTRAEVSARFAEYELALVAEDLDALAGFFWPDATRYGTDGNQAGADAIDAARRVPQAPKHRSLHDTLVRALAPDAAVTETEFARTLDGAPGRQSQVWVRRDGTWAILHAHVSMLPRG